VSPSKKANKPETTTKSKSAQKKTKTSSVRSSHVNQKKGTIETVQPAQVVAPATIIATVEKKKNNVLTNLLRILALFAVVGITLYIFSIRDRVEQFAQFGYPGIFLIALLANATVLLPAPGVAVIYAMGAIFNPIGVALAAGTGGALGELSGYLAGFSGQAVIERTDVYDRVQPWVDKYGGWAIMVLSAIPNPFFDIAGIAAGIAKMPVHTFLIFTWIGQIIKMGIFAFAGRYSIQLFTTFFE
jgi:membrane protein DedA with SNARE-associated domain